MSITLTDVSAAVADYIKQNVTVEVSNVTQEPRACCSPTRKPLSPSR